MAPPSSAYEAPPVQARMPATTQTMRAAPGDPSRALTWLGDEKMPEPMMRPMMSDRPLRYVSVLSFSSEPPPRPPPERRPADVGAPMGAYPPAPAVELSGNKLPAKSKADETEYERPSLPRAAGLPSSRGSSSSTMDSRRDDEMLGRDETSEAAPS